MVTVDDEVYALGSNAHGCLGLGNQQGTLFPHCVEQLCGKGIQSKFPVNDQVIVNKKLLLTIFFFLHLHRFYLWEWTSCASSHRKRGDFFLGTECLL